MFSIGKFPKLFGFIGSLEEYSIEINILFTTGDQKDRSRRDLANYFDHTRIFASNHKLVNTIMDPIERIVYPALQRFGTASMVTHANGTKPIQYKGTDTICF